MELTAEIIEKAYSEALTGYELPNYMVFACSACKKAYVLTKSGPNEICDHLKEILCPKAEV